MASRDLREVEVRREPAFDAMVRASRRSPNPSDLTEYARLEYPGETVEWVAKGRPDVPPRSTAPDRRGWLRAWFGGGTAEER